MDVEKLSAIVTASAADQSFSGVVRVQQGDMVLFEQACGLANRSWNIPNRADTRFRIASISKMFTAAAVLQLIAGGQISFETPIVEALGLEDTTIPPAVNVYHLLTMTAGIADWFDETGDWEANWAELCRTHPIYLLRTNADYLPLFSQQPPPARPGERYAYSGSSYILLGLLIEKVSGISYFDYVRHNIFARAGMGRSDFIALDDPARETAEGYLRVSGPAGEKVVWKKNIYSTTPDAAADGGATSTAADLVRFAQTLRRDAGMADAPPEQFRLLPVHLAQAMLTPQVQQFPHAKDGILWYYGYGVVFMLDEDGRTLRWGHTGEEEGVSCRLFYYPDPGLDVVILGNQSDCAGKLGWDIHHLIYPDE